MDQEKQMEQEQKKEMPTVEVIIKHHKQLFDLLNDPNKMWRVLLMLFLIIIVLFIGLSGVIIVVKKYYPYSTIETNLQGATIMKSEDKEVIYWLFNTADLWANSGIEVEEGDELTIRASGASFTAIHHLVDASNYNTRIDDTWVSTEGQEKHNRRDSLRAQYRISKNTLEGILLMQVIPNHTDSLNHPYYLTHGNIEVIGKERRNLRISQAGVLRFAVNDIVLTDSILTLMYKEYLKSLAELDSSRLGFCIPLDSDTITKCVQTFMSIIKDSTNNQSKIQALKNTNDSIIKKLKKTTSNSDTTLIEKEGIGVALGRYPVLSNIDCECKCKCGCKCKCAARFYNAFPIVNELVYYKEHGMIDPWYKDNLGSFLIVIERKKK